MYGSYFFAEKTVSVAVCQQHSAALGLESCFRISLGIKLDDVRSVRCKICKERDVVGFCHFMIHSHENFVLHLFGLNVMCAAAFLRFRSGKCYSAAGYGSLAAGGHDVSADGTYVKFHSSDIRRNIFVCDDLSREKLRE